MDVNSFLGQPLTEDILGQAAIGSCAEERHLRGRLVPVTGVSEESFREGDGYDVS